MIMVFPSILLGFLSYFPTPLPDDAHVPNPRNPSSSRSIGRDREVLPSELVDWRHLQSAHAPPMESTGSTGGDGGNEDEEDEPYHNPNLFVKPASSIWHSHGTPSLNEHKNPIREGGGVLHTDGKVEVFDQDKSFHEEGEQGENDENDNSNEEEEEGGGGGVFTDLSAYLSTLQSLFPVSEATYIPMGPIPLGTVFPTTFVYIIVGCLFGNCFTRNRPERAPAPANDGSQKYGRTDVELWYIIYHNLFASFIGGVAWFTLSRSLALICFAFEISYEVWDSYLLYSRFKKIDPETLLHHVMAPISIILSTQTTVDFRILLHAGICIDLSGAVMAYAKIYMRRLLSPRSVKEAKSSSSLLSPRSVKEVYRILFFIFIPLRIVLPYFDTVLVLHNYFVESSRRGEPYAWSQLWFLSFMAQNCLNGYFANLIYSKGWGKYTEGYLKTMED